MVTGDGMNRLAITFVVTTLALARLALGVSVDDRAARPFTLEQGLQELGRLKAPLGRDDEEKLFAMIRDRAAHTHMPPADEALFINEILNTLRHLQVDAGRLRAALIGLYRDTGRAPVLRDYALQHLGSMPASADGDREIAEVLFSALEERAGTCAGTALRALLRFVVDGRPLDQQRLADESSRILADDSYAAVARAAAAQTCSQLRLVESLPMVRSLAKSDQTPRVLRLAALRALGILGDERDATYLHAVATAGGFYAVAAGAKRSTPE